MTLLHRYRAVSVIVVSLAAWAPGASDDHQPRKTDVLDRAESRLVQLDVTVTGPPDVIANLTVSDFKLKLASIPITDFELDRLCRDPEAHERTASRLTAGTVTAPATDAPSGPAVPSATLGLTTFLFYFDQNHMTLAGRARSMDVVRDLIPRLIRNGNRGIIVSNAESLETFTAFSSEPQVLLDAVDRLDRDRDQWTLYATEEELRIYEVTQELTSHGIHRAQTLIKLYAADELWRAERDLRRFAMVLGRLAAVDPPKAVVYLADNLREKAGDHYIRLLGDVRTHNLDLDDELRQGRYLGAGTSFDRVINKASSHGTRLYTIQAEGLVPLSSMDAPITYKGIYSTPEFVAPAGRIRDAQDSLAGLALETGGRHFLNGVSPQKIAERILADLSCLYLLSFSPEGLPEDTPLGVKLKMKRPGVQIQARGRLVIQSPSARLTSELLAAFGGPPTDHGEPPLRLSLIPSGYEDGAYSVIVQLAAPGSDLAISTWDMGASVVSSRAVDGTSARITVAAPGAPVISQRTMAFGPGPFEVVGVAHNVTANTILSRRIEGEWPKPGADPASIGPVAVVQPAWGAIRKEDDIATWGPVAYDEPEPLRADLPTALVSIVCRNGPNRPFQVGDLAPSTP